MEVEVGAAVVPDDGGAPATEEELTPDPCPCEGPVPCPGPFCDDFRRFLGILSESRLSARSSADAKGGQQSYCERNDSSHASEAPPTRLE